MKIYNKIFFALSLLFLLSCEKEPQKQVLHPEWYWGEAMAIKNGVCWVAEPYAVESNNSISSRTTIFMSVFSSEGFLRQTLDIVRVPKKEGLFPLYSYQYFGVSDTTGVHFIITKGDGDVVEDGYSLWDGAKDNSIQVTSFDQDSKEIKGTFTATLVIDLPRNNPNAPDTLHFRNGTFHTRIKE